MRHARSPFVALLVALSLAAGACTAGAPPEARSPDGERPAEALDAELVERASTTAERLEALRAARQTGTLGVIERIARTPAPGWAGERVLNASGNDWEPAIAADPNEPFVYVLHNRYGGEPACRRRCPRPAMILHVSRDGGRTWRPERYLCVCRGVEGQYDPLIEVVPETGAVYAVWMNGFRIVFSRSADHGATWSDPVPIHPDVNWGDKPNMALGPDGEDVYVLFNGPTGGDVYAAGSHDAGSTWSTERVTDGFRYFFDYGGIVLPDGRVVFGHNSFLYTGPDGAPEGTTQIHLFASDDGGAGWSELLVDELQLGTECPSRGCYEDYYDGGPVLAADGEGNLVVVYAGASEPLGPRTVYARSSTDGGRTWSDRVRISRRNVNAAFPAAVGGTDGVTRLWFMDQRTGRWNVWYTTSEDLGASWTTPVRISDARSGTAYKDARGFAEVYGDYGEIAVTSSGTVVAAWGEAIAYNGPGGVWFNRER